MANWMGGRLAVANYAAGSETVRERRRAEDSRRRRATEGREQDRDGDRQQPRGALTRAIQPIEQQQQQSARRRRGRGREETAAMDRFNATSRRSSNRRRETQQRGRARERDREDSRDRDRDRDRESGARDGRRGRRLTAEEEYGELNDRYDRRRLRARRYLAAEEEDGWDYRGEDEDERRYGSKRRRRDEEHHEQDNSDYERSAPRRRQRSPSPYTRRSDDDYLPGPPVQPIRLFEPARLSRRLEVRRSDIGSTDRRMSAVEPPPLLNPYQRAQIEGRQQQQRLPRSEQSRVQPIRRAEEDAARPRFLSHRPRSPPFMFDTPPRLFQSVPLPRPTLPMQRRTLSPPHTYPAPFPFRPARLPLEHVPQRLDDARSHIARGEAGRPAPVFRMQRAPLMPTPSPPHTPVALQPRTVMHPLLDGEAFFRGHFLALPDRHSKLTTELAHFAGPYDRTTWPQRTITRAIPPLCIPSTAALPTSRLLAANTPLVRQPQTQRAAVVLPSPPSASAVFRSRPPPIVPPAKHDGGREAVTAPRAGSKPGHSTAIVSNNEHTAGNELSVQIKVAVTDKQQKQASIATQSAPQPATAAKQQPVAEIDDEKTVRSSADGERALAACDEAAAVVRSAEMKADEAVKPLPQQPSSPIIETDADAERKEEAAGRVQSDAESTVSSHYAFVGPAKYDGGPWVRQLLIDNGIHVVDFDDERCNIAFLESDYTPAHLSPQPIPSSREQHISFYDVQYIRDTAVGTARDLEEYRLSKPSERH